MVRVVAEESQARTTIGILEGLSKYKEVGESGYIRVAIRILQPLTGILDLALAA